MTKNDFSQGKRFYGLHFLPGVAEYAEDGQKRIFLNEDTIRKMDATFEGKPVFVHHVDKVEQDKVPDGYVVKSFYNAADGKHWAEFIVITDRGMEAISNGFRLSNAYIPKEKGPGGLWNGVQYQEEVLAAEYEHLALVPNPRYDESVILTPEQFKVYNEQKSLELKKIANSRDKVKKGDISMFKFFKKEKIENAVDLEATMVTLPQSKKDLSIAEVIEAADRIINMAGYADGDHMVKVCGKEMSVNDLVEAHEKMMKEKEEKNDESAEGNKETDKKEMEEGLKKENVDLDGGEDEGMKEWKKADKTENEEEKEEKMNKKKNGHFEALKNAHMIQKDSGALRLGMDEVARGRAKYGRLINKKA